VTVPQQLAFGAFVLYALVALFADTAPSEVEEMGKLTMFLIAALLPSDALIRYGRNLLFQTVDDPDKAAQNAPATTLAQVLAVATYAVVLALTLFPGVSTLEFTNVNEAARVLIVALLPSDAGIRFGRAIYFRSDKTPTPTIAQLKKV
jgi:DMSO reductase anchor subunit